MRHWLLSLSLFVSLAAGLARADVNYDRRVWSYEGGFLIEIESNSRWIEVIGDTPTFAFKETHRNDQYITLYDPQRYMSVTLYVDRMKTSVVGDGVVHTPHFGGWDHRRALSGDTDVPGLVASGHLDRFADWTFFWFRDRDLVATMKFHELSRDSRGITTKNAETGLIFYISTAGVVTSISPEGTHTVVMPNGKWVDRRRPNRLGSVRR